MPRIAGTLNRCSRLDKKFSRVTWKLAVLQNLSGNQEEVISRSQCPACGKTLIQKELTFFFALICFLAMKHIQTINFQSRLNRWSQKTPNYTH